MEHAPILANTAISSEMVKNMKPHYLKIWVEANMNKNGGVVWKKKSMVHQNE